MHVALPVVASPGAGAAAGAGCPAQRIGTAVSEGVTSCEQASCTPRCQMWRPQVLEQLQQ